MLSYGELLNIFFYGFIYFLVCIYSDIWKNFEIVM